MLGPNVAFDVVPLIAFGVRRGPWDFPVTYGAAPTTLTLGRG
jgi:hypothetical protein